MKFSGDNMLRGDYHVTNQNDVDVYDGFDISGSYVALTVQFNGLLSYKPRKEKAPKEKDIEPEDTIIDIPPLTELDTNIVDVIIDDKTANDRDFKVTNKVKVTSKTVKIYIWDHQIEDGDRVNLILNDHQILTDYTLRNKKLELEVTLEPGVNNFILYALNLGKYKPNTAAVMIDDGNKQQQVILESTLDESGAIEIKFEQK